MENGQTTITYNPEDKSKRVPLENWLKTMGKTRHLTKPENAAALESFREEVERRWQRLLAKHDNPYL
ncbi:hypothetical protein D3C77_495950 [compost metagenome]